MTFNVFLTEKILPIFYYIINWIGQIVNNLMNNYVFLIIVYISIIIIIINTIKEIINLITNRKNKKLKDKGN